MDRAIPCGSKLCAKREDVRRHVMHRERVKTVRPQVDTAEPYVAHMDHVRTNLKREQLLEERYSEIDRENRILLKKMSGIMSTPRSEERRGPGPSSLNRDARKKELLRITKENQNILRRIQQAQPVYNHVEMEGTHRRNTSYLKNCAEYPLVIRTPRSARGGPGHISSELVRLGEERVEDGRPQSARSFGGAGRAPSAGAVSSPSAAQGRRRGEDHAAAHEEALKCVLKEGRWIGSAYYLVEMATDSAGTLQITAFDGEAQVQLDLIVKEKVHRKLFRELNGDYSQLVARLSVVVDTAGYRQLLLEEDPPRHAAVAPAMPSSAPLQQQQQQQYMPPSTAGTVRSVSVTNEGELDAEAMVVYKAKSGSAGSVHAEVDFGSTLGDTTVRMRGLTPGSEAGYGR